MQRPTHGCHKEAKSPTSEVKDMDGALHFIYIQYVRWCKAHSTSYTSHVFSVTMLGISKGVSKHYPILGSEVKAAHNKTMMYFLASIAVDFDTRTPHSKLRTTCICALAECFRCFDLHDRWMSQDSADLAYKMGNLFCSTYITLAANAVHEKQCLYKVRPKLHDFQEILVQVRLDHQNPLYYQCINDEHMLGIFKRTCKGCHRKSAGLKLCLRYLAELSRVWDGRQ
jgi:hypothetical protein